MNYVAANNGVAIECGKKNLRSRGLSQRQRDLRKVAPVTILRETPEGLVLKQVEFRKSGKPTAAGARTLAELNAA